MMKLGENIVVAVHGFGGNQVRIDIVTPKSVSIHREEIYSPPVINQTS